MNANYCMLYVKNVAHLSSHVICGRAFSAVRVNASETKCILKIDYNVKTFSFPCTYLCVCVYSRYNESTR